MDYLDFDLEIGEGTGREFPVAVLRSPAGEARGTMRFPYDELALKNQLLTLQNALLRSGGKRRSALSPELQAVRGFGQALFDALITGEVRSCYDVSLERAHRAGQGLRLRLRFQSPTLAVLPWEFLYDYREAEYVCLTVNTPLVRYLELPRPPQALAVAPPLHILGLVCSPQDLPTLDVENEKRRVEQALQNLRDRGLVELHWMAEPTWRALQGEMRRGCWHVFHFVGHGGFDASADEGLIYLADEGGKARPLRATELGRLLADKPHLRLAVLNACEGARGSERDIFSSTASILVRRGLPAVVAMQYEITDRAAIELSRSFYEALADNLPVDAAVAEARKAVSLAVTNSVEWGTPVLTMRAPDGVLFDLTGRVAPAQAVAAYELVTGPVAEPATAAREPAIRKEAPVAEGPRIEPVAALKAQPPHVRMPEAQLVGEARTPGARRLWSLIALAAVVVTAVAIFAYQIGKGRQPEEVARSPSALPTTAPTVTSVSGIVPTPARARSPVPTAQGAAPTATLVTATAAPLVPSMGGTLVMTTPVRMELVRVPAGEFLMGSDPAKDSQAYTLEKPHRVTLAEFYVGKYEVTNAQYAAFVTAAGHAAPSGWQDGAIPAGKDDHPVVLVKWDDASAFAQWLGRETGMGFRLCTEAEWEKACRGTGSLIYPWGDGFDPNRANTRESSIGTTTPAGKYSPSGDSPYGVSDMAGNVWEWVEDWYSESYYASSPSENPQGPESGDLRVLRGGSFDSWDRAARCAHRYHNSPVFWFGNGGFRVCASPGLAEPFTATPKLSTPTVVQPTAMSALPASTAVQPTAIAEPPSPTVLPDKVVLTDKGAIVTEPVRMELVRVPAGEFLMGSDPAKDSLAYDESEKPQHQVTLSEFYIGKYEVTNAQYAAFVKTTGRTAPMWPNGVIPAGEENHPVVGVIWNDAMTLLQWLAEETGMAFRLCTEAEWEKACRGESGLIYPWGDTFDVNKANTFPSFIGMTTPVGRYSPGGDSPYGVADLAGNVWEWTSSAFRDYPYDPADGREDTASTGVRVLRGGSYFDGESGARCAERDYATAGDHSVLFGLRVCVSPGLSTPSQ